MAFLRNLLAVLVGLFIFFFLGFFILVGMVSALERDEKPTVKTNSTLYLNLSGVIAERVPEDPLEDILPTSSPQMIDLRKLLSAIEAAKSDEKIKGIYMELQYISSGFASLQEIRDALTSFQDSGKFVYAYSEYMSEADYYLASAADKIFLHPEGQIEFNGLSANVTFWKGLFDKLEIKPQIFRVGEFKSFVEPFIRTDMSEENRLQMSELLNAVYGVYIGDVAKSRGIDETTLRTISDELSVQVPQDAVELNLVDQLGYKDEVKQLIMEAVGEEDEKDLDFISFKNYSKTLPYNYAKNKIAVIMADGPIVMGGDDYSVVGERFAREIRKARENSSVKAIVLRVNSPGGSLVASDIIWREVERTKGVKPIIASMSDVAASGGYYIAMNCDTIIAQPNTITGSIGIFGMMFSLEDFLANKLGITHDVVNTGDNSDMWTMTRDLTPFERSVIQKSVEQGYATFIQKAAAGRDMPEEAVRKVAGGRVWSGSQAKENGLIDLLGSFEDAIELAAELGDVADDYRVSYYPYQKPFMEQLLGSAVEEVNSRFTRNHILSPYLEQIEQLTQMRGIQARMPLEFEIY